MKRSFILSVTEVRKDWQWGDGTLLQELCPGFRLILDEDGNEYPAERERVGLITLSVTKNARDNTFLIDNAGYSVCGKGLGAD